MSESIVFDVGANKKKKEDSTGLLDRSLDSIIADKRKAAKAAHNNNKPKKVQKEIQLNSPRIVSPKLKAQQKTEKKAKNTNEIIIKRKIEPTQNKRVNNQPVKKVQTQPPKQKTDFSQIKIHVTRPSTSHSQKNVSPTPERVVKPNLNFKKKFKQQTVRINASSNDSERRVTVEKPKVQRHESNNNSNKPMSLSDRFGKKH